MRMMGLVLVAGLVLAGGCSDSKTPPPAAPLAPKTVSQPVTQATVTAAVASAPVYTYDPKGRRDPFSPIIVKEDKKANLADRPPLEQYSIHEFKFAGIIWGGFGYNAMLEGPDGKGYLVRVGTVIGPNKGVVKKITQNSMVIEEKFKNYSGEFDRKEIIVDFRKKQEGTP
jgi:type IV pilus assembly protein PilP